MTNYVHVVNLSQDYWGVVTSVFSVLAALGALVVAGCSWRHSVRVARDSAKMNHDTMAEQKRVADHQINHDKRSIMPALSIYANLSMDVSEFNMGFCLQNKGLGPAIIAPVLMLLDGDPVGLMVYSASRDLMAALHSSGATKDINITWSNGIRDIVPNGKRNGLLWLDSKAEMTEEIENWFIKINSRVGFIIPYTSLYEEKIFWAVHNSDISRYPKDILEKLWPDLMKPS